MDKPTLVILAFAAMLIVMRFIFPSTKLRKGDDLMADHRKEMRDQETRTTDLNNIYDNYADPDRNR